MRIICEKCNKLPVHNDITWNIRSFDGEALVKECFVCIVCRRTLMSLLEERRTKAERVFVGDIDNFCETCLKHFRSELTKDMEETVKMFFEKESDGKGREIR